LEERSIFEFGNFPRRDELRATPWLYEPFVLRGKVTTIEPNDFWGGGLALQLAIHGSLGVPFRGRKAREGSFKTVFFDWDDGLEGLSWRASDICEHFGFDLDESARNIRILAFPESIRRKMIRGRWVDDGDLINAVAAEVASRATSRCWPWDRSALSPGQSCPHGECGGSRLSHMRL
jgi:hypothetical protein